MPPADRGIDYVRHQYDNARPLETQLRWAPTISQYVGDPVDLDGTDVTVSIRRERDHVLVMDDAVVTVTNTALGHVAVHLVPAVTAEVGGYVVEWRVRWGDGSDLRWPAEVGGTFDHLLVKESLMGSTVPIAGTFPSTTLGSSSSALLLVPDNDTTQTVTVNNQAVFAGGAGTSVAIGAAVELFTVAAMAGETPWSTGVTPTLVPASGTTLDPSVTTAMEASEGDEVTLYLNGTVWYPTTPTAGTGGAVDVDSYTHLQPVADSTWTINHGLNRAVAVSIEDDLGNDVFPNDIDHTNLNQVVVTFLGPISGTARIT